MFADVCIIVAGPTERNIYIIYGQEIVKNKLQPSSTWRYIIVFLAPLYLLWGHKSGLILWGWDKSKPIARSMERPWISEKPGVPGNAGITCSHGKMECTVFNHLSVAFWPFPDLLKVFFKMAQPAIGQ